MCSSSDSRITSLGVVFENINRVLYKKALFHINLSFSTKTLHTMIKTLKNYQKLPNYKPPSCTNRNSELHC